MLKKILEQYKPIWMRPKVNWYYLKNEIKKIIYKNIYQMINEDIVSTSAYI